MRGIWYGSELPRKPLGAYWQQQRCAGMCPRGPKMTRANAESIRCIPWGKRSCQFQHGGFCVSSSFAWESAWLSLYWRMHETLVFFAFAWCLAYSLAQSMSYSIWRQSLFARGLSFTSMLLIWLQDMQTNRTRSHMVLAMQCPNDHEGSTMPKRATAQTRGYIC